MSDITKLYVTDGGTLTLIEPYKEDVLLNAILGQESTPEMSTQEILDHLADNDIFASVLYEGNGRFSMTVFMRGTSLVSGMPSCASSYIEAVQIAHEIALDLEWIE